MLADKEWGVPYLDGEVCGGWEQGMLLYTEGCLLGLCATALPCYWGCSALCGAQTAFTLPGLQVRCHAVLGVWLLALVPLAVWQHQDSRSMNTRLAARPRSLWICAREPEQKMDSHHSLCVSLLPCYCCVRRIRWTGRMIRTGRIERIERI